MDIKRIEKLKEVYALEAHPEGGWFSECYTSAEDKGGRAMAVIPKGAIFAAENLDKDSFCFMSCATSPKFTYDGFRLIGEKEIRDICGEGQYKKYVTLNSDPVLSL